MRRNKFRRVSSSIVVSLIFSSLFLSILSNTNVVGTRDEAEQVYFRKNLLTPSSDVVDSSVYRKNINLSLGIEERVLLNHGRLTNLFIELGSGNYYLSSHSDLTNFTYILKIGNHSYYKNGSQPLRNILLKGVAELEIVAYPLTKSNGNITILITKEMGLEEKYTSKALYSSDSIVYSILLTKGTYSLKVNQKTGSVTNTVFNLFYSNDYRFESIKGEAPNNKESKRLDINVQSRELIYIKLQIQKGGGVFELYVEDFSLLEEWSKHFKNWLNSLDIVLILSIIITVGVNGGMIYLFFFIKKKELKDKIFKSFSKTKLIRGGRISSENSSYPNSDDEVFID